ncbi:hypothetical protein J437_LFUL000020 [Ladona fulva]|uniref:Reverse transcriptase domain-containing protein n=1 Tax=Ladona fulva TaxID=123851 RepID=A0A8K0JZY8_LADFU|nr:hypothetical protein J437_LFUL000020 [Ladona fulva]
MANVGGPKQCKRKLLMAMVESQLLYGAKIWASALNTAKYRKRITVVQRRGALRVACSYRTVSEADVLVIAGTIPIDLLAKERKRKSSGDSDLAPPTSATVLARTPGKPRIKRNEEEIDFRRI